MENNLIAKKAVAKASAELVEDGMTIGLGTGTTATWLIEYLSQRCKKGLNILAVATSKETAKLAKKGGIPLLENDEFVTLDLTIDGADEVDRKKRLIKGRGGALVREKITASSSREMIVIVDSSKLVDLLGKAPLPIEILPFGYRATIQKIESKGYKAILRVNPSSIPYLSVNGNYTVDVHFERPLLEPEKDEQRIINIPGVVDTGFFFNLAGRVLVGYPDGHIEILGNNRSND